MLGVGFFVHCMSISLVLNATYLIAPTQREEEHKPAYTIEMNGITMSNNTSSRLHLKLGKSSNSRRHIHGNTQLEQMHSAMMSQLRNWQRKTIFHQLALTVWKQSVHHVVL